MDYNPEEDRRILDLQARLLTLERELSDCQKERSAAQDKVEHFRVFSERVKDYAFITFGLDTRIVSWSRGAERIFGYSESEILGQPASIIFTPEDRDAGADEVELATARTNGCAEDERWHIRKDGTRFWASGILTAHRDSNNSLHSYSKVLRNLTARKLAENRLRASEEQFRLYIENVRDYALVPVDVRGRISGWNSGAQRTFGYSEQEIIGRPAAALFTPEDAEKGESEKDLELAVANGRAEDERWMVRKDGSRFWARWVTTAMYDDDGELRGFAKVLRDETEKKSIEDRLKESLQQTEVLLREIHHRVKNNLNVITSLLSMQAADVSDKSVQRMFGELRDRVQAIAALHETLYGSPNLGEILFGPYMEHLLSDLIDVHQSDTKHVLLRIQSDDVVLSIEQALPLGLIVNELASNALKHAFPNGREGTINVSLRYVGNCSENGEKDEDGFCELIVHDDGVGVRTAGGSRHNRSLGLQLVQLLTAQLHGSVAWDQTTPGTRISLRFPLTAVDTAWASG